MSATIGSVPLNHAVTFVRVEAETGVRRRLAEFGFRPGAPLTVLRRTAGGGRVVDVAGSRIALDAATAGAIHVAVAA